MTGVRGTGWGGFNAITEYITHESSFGRKKAGTAKEEAGNLMLSVVNGAARDMAQRVLSFSWRHNVSGPLRGPQHVSNQSR